MNNKIKKVGTFIACIFIFLTTDGQSRILEVTAISQPQSNWCWAASIAIISTYYGNNPSVCSIAEWTRLNIPWALLGNYDCCGTTPADCNKGLGDNDFPKVFSSQNITSTVSSNVMSLAGVMITIDDNRPIMMECTKGTGSKHVMVIVGYENSLLHYIDPADGLGRTCLYSDAISTECLGLYNSRWTWGTTVPRSIVCPPYLSLHSAIGANANIHAQTSIISDGVINNNSTVSFVAGNSIMLNPGFEIQLGSTLTATISTIPCQ